MAQRKKPYTVGIRASFSPKPGLSVVETFVALDKIIERFVRKHKGHIKLRPSLPFVTITLASGKEVKGLLRQATEDSASLFPQHLFGHVHGMHEKTPLYRIETATPAVVRMASVDMVEFSFPQYEVKPDELTS